ncbi:hypothetical protein G7Y89_g2546 [Cudoniella acicularis]|uniref:Uncharacterized protein n=1 Tax=Cudoniella acicularis TaxID=354080 RepID=A0A8H4W6E6_9HELO|nr:hypothetical protein G7Y89_g2546 [Cudoniella acicularis]
MLPRPYYRLPLPHCPTLPPLRSSPSFTTASPDNLTSVTSTQRSSPSGTCLADPSTPLFYNSRYFGLGFFLLASQEAIRQLSDNKVAALVCYVTNTLPELPRLGKALDRVNYLKFSPRRNPNIGKAGLYDYSQLSSGCYMIRLNRARRCPVITSSTTIGPPR